MQTFREAFHGHDAARMEWLGNKLLFTKEETSRDKFASRVAAIETLQNRLPKEQAPKFVAAVRVLIKTCATPKTLEEVNKFFDGGATEADRVGAATEAEEIFQAIADQLALDAAPLEGHRQPATVEATLGAQGLTLSMTSSKNLHVQRLSKVLDSTMMMWQGTTLKMLPTGSKSDDAQACAYVGHILDKRSTPTFDDREIELGLPALRQALVSADNLAAFFHGKNCEDGTVLHDNMPPVGETKKAGFNDACLMMATVTMMFWLSARDKHRNESSIHPAIAVEILLEILAGGGKNEQASMTTEWVKQLKPRPAVETLFKAAKLSLPATTVETLPAKAARSESAATATATATTSAATQNSFPLPLLQPQPSMMQYVSPLGQQPGLLPLGHFNFGQFPGQVMEIGGASESPQPAGHYVQKVAPTRSVSTKAIPKAPPASAAAPKPDIVCFRCGKKGHRKRECRSKTTAEGVKLE